MLKFAKFAAVVTLSLNLLHANNNENKKDYKHHANN